MIDAPADLLHRIRAHGQDHLLTGWSTLSVAERRAFVGQLAGIDFGELERLYARRGEPHTLLPDPSAIAPMPVEDAASFGPDTLRLGEECLRRGEVAVLVVAGGQGSRLGFEQPKGLFPVGPVSGASLFRLHAEKVHALSRKYGVAVPLLVMTSAATTAETQAYFLSQNSFGLPRSQVIFFEQGTMPALDAATGQLLLSQPGALNLSPNGHGGTLTALADTGLLADLKARGVKHVFYFQVDNPLVELAAPGFVGRHVETNSDASTKVVFKTRPDEKVGVLALLGGKCGIVEYSDLPGELANARDAHGELLHRAGNTAIHLFSVAFLERVTQGTDRLAFHLARKKVPYFDAETGTAVKPTTENALKFELFVFDALPLADRWLTVRVRREDEFAPLKNASGADSPEAVRAALSDFHARRLRAVGVEVADGVAVEIAPLFALTDADLRAKIPAGTRVTGPTFFE